MMDVRGVVAVAAFAGLTIWGVNVAYRSAMTHEASTRMAANGRDDEMSWRQTATTAIAMQLMHDCGGDRDCWTSKLAATVAGYAREGFSDDQRKEFGDLVLAKAGMTATANQE